MQSPHIRANKELGFLLVSALSGYLGHALRNYAFQKEMLSLKMAPFVEVQTYTALGKLLIALGMLCWLVAIVSLLPLLCRTVRWKTVPWQRRQSRLKAETT
ncbi:MAG: hypothetical protein JRJ12_06330 [Deltaproteobacteria bacterium]|nr:hypothetical protein [Deltaproteobacteria bacterium]MBW2069651.1 hypothetical protein [Deltaproteobacteria bacterium]